MPNPDQRLPLSFRRCVRRILHRFPFSRFTHQQHLDVLHTQRPRFAFESRRSRAQGQLRHSHLRIAYHSQHRRFQPLRYVRRQFLQRGFRHREKVRVLRALVFFPSQRLYHSRKNPIRLSHVPVIVKSPNHQAIFLDERPLLLPDCVVLIHSFRSVQVIVKRRLVRDDQVLPFRRPPLQHVQRRHHRYRHTRPARLPTTPLQRLHPLRLPCPPISFLLTTL